VNDSFFIISGDKYPEELVGRTVEHFRSQAVVVHPTETIHGYGSRYDSARAIERIRIMKGREKDKPMVLLIPGQAWVDLLVRDVPDPARKLTEAFWPGPLTIVFRTGAKALEKCPWLNQTVALRRTAHPFTSRVLRELDLPIVSTSINRSGRPVPPDPLKYLEKLARRKKSTPELIPELAVIDQKLQDSGSYPSTIVRVVDEETVQVIRHGALSAEIIAERAGIKVVDTL